MNLEGDLKWYLSVQYTRCATTGAVTFPAKCDDILAQLAQPIPNPDPALVKQFQTLVGGLLYLQVHTSRSRRNLRLERRKLCGRQGQRWLTSRQLHRLDLHV